MTAFTTLGKLQSDNRSKEGMVGDAILLHKGRN
jgi:hypothetical protein